ncbi:F0F1 ATP synthase subunit epsilon [Neomicrococcus aestuarii]|uniref:ATP synthase epsilon chain n=1 Tax=Neomicrococcus aestuarii TaxID=556325 RepID=A0A1L2ZLG6_9MICC|nr:F0F1 ATP synthase subunit epsilon [Neomicrococcus aestuarii]APF39871.1 ATP synthase F1 subunit epsilon [Neomicrococcus aestuarii]MBB5513921.1 F-type H+-transporting ATPase subunit epsilon [Neomicrococcus aestuarii]
MAELQVEVVAADHFLWSGAATLVKARTSEGEIGVLPGHTPVLAVLAPGELEIVPVEGNRITLKADGGFFSVDSNRVVIVADNAEMQESA